MNGGKKRVMGEKRVYLFFCDRIHSEYSVLQQKKNRTSILLFIIIIMIFNMIDDFLMMNDYRK